ncbi:monooxygenase [Aliidongia dinghuensis]|uniref:Monooxygenase n=1 Tax=Aliidongia dinghuensis TaxID=1867774 RepID=A0A8J3E6A0_9PROT|nr:LLM class flavin-dependent oxidoreductase [Aliidongia dinghuensis]GGF42530.1 monooxygenase [Aliidongia dinghuensis]
MRYGYWLPVFGGWLRNVADEGMEASWDYARRLAKRSEEIGYDLTLIAELTMNDIKAADAPTLDAWSTAAALAAVTTRLELMVAVRPTFHHPAALAKQAANIDQISKGRLSLNVVSAWWADEARRYGLAFDTHDDRYARTRDWLAVVDGLWREPMFTHRGSHYTVEDAIVAPKPVSKPRPTLYAGGESEAAKEMIASLCDAYVMHGDPVDRIRTRIEDMRVRRDRLGLPAMRFGMAAYAIVRDSRREAEAELARVTDVHASAAGYENYRQWLGNTQQDVAPSLAEYSVSNRGLRPNFVGTPEEVRERLEEYEAAGLDLVLLQCSPQAEEMERFAAQVIRRT